MHRTVAIVGFEPALQSSLRALLSREPGLQVADQDSTVPDIFLISPPTVEWVMQLRARFPHARLVALLPWHRRSDFAQAPIDEFVDGLAGYESLLSQILPSD